MAALFATVAAITSNGAARAFCLTMGAGFVLLAARVVWHLIRSAQRTK
jgi:hypothetical protein